MTPHDRRSEEVFFLILTLFILLSNVREGGGGRGEEGAHLMYSDIL